MDNCLLDDSNLLDANPNIWDMFDKNDIEDDYDEFKSSEPDLHETYACEECKTYTLVYQDGQHVCSSCGLIQQKKLSHDAEYRFYGDSDNKMSNPERVGMPANYMLPQSSF